MSESLSLTNLICIRRPLNLTKIMSPVHNIHTRILMCKMYTRTDRQFAK